MAASIGSPNAGITTTSTSLTSSASSISSSTPSSQTSESAISLTSTTATSSSNAAATCSTISSTVVSNATPLSPTTQTSNPASQTTPANKTSHQTTSNNLSTGATAGIAIGSAFAGALIAASIVWLLMRRKRRTIPIPAASKAVSSPSGKRYEDAGPPVRDLKSALPTTTGAAFARTKPDAESSLPQPADTNKIAKEISLLRTLLESHCDNFYFKESINARSFDRGTDHDVLSKVADGDMPASRLVESLVNVQTRADAILFVLASTIIKRLEPKPTSVTLLPAGVALCLQSMDSRPNLNSFDAEARDRLLSKWRVITGYLTTSRYVTHAFSTDDERVTSIHTTVTTISSIIGSLANQEKEASRQENLVEIIKRATRFGNELVSQPSAWRFDWTAQRPQMGLVVFPGLVQMTDDDGMRLPSGLVVGQKKVSKGIRGG